MNARSRSAVMDPNSPISFDFTFPFSSNSPQTSRDINTSNQTNSNVNLLRHNGGNQADISSAVGQTMLTGQHRTSIDSMLDQEGRIIWSSNASNQAQRQGSAVSFSNDPPEVMQDKNSADDEKAPAWSELKTKAGKERKRLPLACIACRRKKIKCSGEKPACKHCLRARVPCVYKVTTRKAAPRTDYMGMLDKRLKRMEDRVIKMIPKEDMPDFAITGRASVRPPLPGQAVKKEKATTNKRSAEEAFDSELSDWAQGRKTGNASDKPPPTRNQRETDNKLSTEGAEALPPQHLQEHLAEIFFDCVYGQSYLLLHKPSFMRKLKAGNVPPVLILAVCAVSARFSTHPQVNTEPAFLRGEQWATPARKIAEKRHFEPNVTILTVMIILGLHHFGTCEGGLSWSFGGQAMRMGYALQLHRELDQNPLGQAHADRAAASGISEQPKMKELSFTDREIRRRLMWACYLMDTFNSSGTERPSFLNEDYMKIQLPIEESRFQLEMPGLTEDIEGHVPLTVDTSTSPDQVQAEAKANMGVGAYVIRAVVVWKRIVQYLNLGGKEKDSYPLWDSLSHFASLQRQITQLESGLPESLKYTPDNLAIHVTKRSGNQFLFLHIIIAQTSLFLHRFAVPTAPNVHRPYPLNTPKSFLASSAATVIEAAARISRVIADSTGHTLTVPFAGYCAYASATVHVWGIFSRNVGLEASSKEHLRHNYRYLTRMKRYWGIFHYMAESIKDIYRAFAEAAVHLRGTRAPRASTAAGDTKAAVDSINMSADPSRDVTPTPGADSQSGQGDGSSERTLSPAKSKSGSGKPMFQYGDWFNKYPHGVSATEWETTHLPHRNEAQKGTEAVMSQQSDLQSVEEFFASLSPPSKVDNETLGGQRGRKVARKRGKSVTENTNSNTSASEKSKEQTRQPQDVQVPPNIQIQSQPHQLHQSAAGLGGLAPDAMQPNIDYPMAEYSTQQAPLQTQAVGAFDLASPSPMFQGRPSYAFSIDSPTAGSAASSIPPGHGQAVKNPGTNFNFNYTSALPHLDRQMVFGAYAGIDPSNSGNSSALNNPNNLGFWNSPWDGNDANGLVGFDDPFALSNQNTQANLTNNMTNTGVMSGGPNAGLVGGNANSAAMGSSAWFMPFNIDPPEYGIDDFNITGLEGMDFGSGGVGLADNNNLVTDPSGNSGGGGSLSGPNSSTPS